MDVCALRNQVMSVKLTRSQMSADNIAKVFNVFPHSIVLVGEDGTIATLDSNGDFCLYEMNANVLWTVNGDPSKPTATDNFLSARPRPSMTYTYQQPDSIRASQLIKAKWKPSGASKQEAKRSIGNSWTKTLEICRYEVDMAIKKTFNFPLTLTEQTSSVSGVADIASAEAFGGEPVVTLDSKNLWIPDSIGTRGKCVSLSCLWSSFIGVLVANNTVPSRKRAHYGISAHPPLWVQVPAKV